MKTTTYCHKMAMISRCFVFMSAILILSFPLQAQEREDFQAEITTDIVSRNIWRGVYQAGGSIQPSLTAGYKNFELYVWGTTDFQATSHEVDFTISYTFRGFTLGITDYWCGNNTDTYSRNHQFERNLKYAFDKIPLSLEWNTIFYGEDKPFVYSSYAEIKYKLELPSINFDFSLGFTPWKNQVLETDKFAVTNLLATAGKRISISSLFDMFPSCTLLYNPTTDQLFFVAKIGFLFSK
ncbi:MAG: hypothetical protein LBQ22_02400 [Bacteroidales bacterium]|jgi:hypothetical protein|nr:hypothetical protein [Bacteroidales bacterium]